MEEQYNSPSMNKKVQYNPPSENRVQLAQQIEHEEYNQVNLDDILKRAATYNAFLEYHKMRQGIDWKHTIPNINPYHPIPDDPSNFEEFHRLSCRLFELEEEGRHVWKKMLEITGLLKVMDPRYEWGIRFVPQHRQKEI